MSPTMMERTGCARVRKYDSGTSSWVDVGSSTNVSDDASVSNNNFSVRLCMDGNTPYVAYQDDATKTIFVKKYDGTQWVVVGGQGIACVEGISHVSLVVKAGVPYLAFIRKAATPVMNAWKCDSPRGFAAHQIASRVLTRPGICSIVRHYAGQHERRSSLSRLALRSLGGEGHRGMPFPAL